MWLGEMREMYPDLKIEGMCSHNSLDVIIIVSHGKDRKENKVKPSAVTTPSVPEGEEKPTVSSGKKRVPRSNSK